MGDAVKAGATVVETDPYTTKHNINVIVWCCLHVHSADAQHDQIYN